MINKILYLLDEDISNESGVTKKIKSQIHEWECSGIRVKVISLRSNSLYSSIDNGEVLGVYDKSNNVLSNFILNYKLFKVLKLRVKKFKPDLIYCRYVKFSPNMVKSFCKTPHVVEINTNDKRELKSKNSVSYILNNLTRSYFLRKSKGFVFVTNELRKSSAFSCFTKPSIIIPNGLNAQKSILKYDKENPCSKYNVVFIGSPDMSWHGIDKILYLAKKLPDVDFNIIGVEDEGESTDNVFFRGYLNHKEMQPYLDNASVALSTLALHRKGMKEACPLKSRQYLLNGLPIIIGYDDPDLTEPLPFILNVGNYENNIIDNIENISSFIKGASLHNKMTIKEFAVDKLSWKEKEKLRLSFLNNCIDGS